MLEVPFLLMVSPTTRSSSSRKLVSCGSDLALFLAPGRAHWPSGSIVTCSSESDVSARISFAYLMAR